MTFHKTPGVGATVRFLFTTNAATGAAVAPLSAFEAADVILYKDGSATQRTSTAGWTMTSPFDSITGLHQIAMDLSDNTDAGFYAVGSEYELVLSPDTETVDGVAVVAVIGAFRIVAVEAVAGVPKVDTTHAAGTAWASGAITAAVIADGAIDRATFAADTGLLSARSATAQAGSTSTTIVLDALASATTDIYKHNLIITTGGTGAGQARLCTAYNGSTKVATISDAWVTTPDNTTTFAVVPADQPAFAWLPQALVGGRVDASVGAVAAAAITNAALAADTGLKPAQTGTVSSSTSGTVTLGGSDGASAVDSFYQCSFIIITGGTGAGQARDIVAYSGASRLCTLGTNWVTAPGAASTYAIIAYDKQSTFTVIAGVQSDTNDIQTRLPAALVSGRMDSSTGAMAANVLTATAINADAFTAAKFAADVTTELQAGLATAASLTTVGTNVSTILAAVDTEVATIVAGVADIQARIPAALVSGRIDASVGAMATDVLTSTALAASAVTEIQSGLATSTALATVAGYIDTEVASILADTTNIKTRLPAALVGGKMDSTASVTLADGDIDAGTLTAAACNKIADHALRRSMATAELSANGDTLAFRSLLGACSKLANRIAVAAGTLTVYKTDDATALGTQTVTSDSGADPVVELDTV